MSQTHHSAKIAVGVAGATGLVGQRFISLLSHHPYFYVSCVSASDRNVGKRFIDACNWKLATPMPSYVENMVLCATNSQAFLQNNCKVVFSAMDASVAGELESEMAEAGLKVFSNAKNHRYDPDVPILIPHANPEHVHILPSQQKQRGYTKGGYIVTNANCSSTGLVVALRPLLDAFGLDKVMVVTMQAISGAGYPGVASLDITDNIIPYISGEEPKMEMEPQKILGTLNDNNSEFIHANFDVSATCNRVHVIDGHSECVSIKLRRPASIEEITSVLKSYTSEAQRLNLPSAPRAPIYVHDATIENRPQPRLDRDRENGYVVTIGRVRKCPIFDVKFTLCSHNTVLGAAGGSILNAELAFAKGLL